MKKILVVVAALAVCVGGYFVYQRYAVDPNKKYSEDITDKGFKIATSDGTVSGQYEDASKLNLDMQVYSNASLAGDKKSAGNFDMNGKKYAAATYQTNDSRDKVESFYTNQYGSDLAKGEITSGDQTYKIFKSKANAASALVLVWVDNKITYFTIFKSL